MKEETIVRENLMTDKNYSAFCGSMDCRLGMPRTLWNKDKNQFICKCGWVSEFPEDFIKRYKLKHKL